jgi:hypothetical protein
MTTPLKFGWNEGRIHIDSLEEVLRRAEEAPQHWCGNCTKNGGRRWLPHPDGAYYVIVSMEEHIEDKRSAAEAEFWLRVSQINDGELS